MTKEVLVQIAGLQLDTEEQPIEISSWGIYHLRNGKHYIQYEEIQEGGKAILKNTIKISDHRIDLIKKGSGATQMIFDLEEVTDTIYQTPYCDLQFKIHTTELLVEETEQEISVKLLYQLSSNGEHLSNNRIQIKICSR